MVVGQGLWCGEVGGLEIEVVVVTVAVRLWLILPLFLVVVVVMVVVLVLVIGTNLQQPLRRCGIDAALLRLGNRVFE